MKVDEFLNTFYPISKNVSKEKILPNYIWKSMIYVAYHGPKVNELQSSQQKSQCLLRMQDKWPTNFLSHAPTRISLPLLESLDPITMQSM